MNLALLSKYDTILVAYSGGIDSQTLLYIITEEFKDKKIIALHVNHGISNNADAWASFCKKEALKRNIEFKELKLSLSKNNEGLEEEARNLRYSWFEEESKLYENSVLVTGHHMNDQIETVLFRLFRGTGIAGLTGIPEINQRNTLTIFRPLLNKTKAQLISYAIEKKLGWVEDDSNTENTFDRNFIRNEIMPLIISRFPNAEKGISQCISEFQKIHDSEKKLALNNLSFCIDNDNKLLAKEVLKYNNINHIIREWFKSHNGQYPNKNILNTLKNDMIYKEPHNSGKIIKHNYIVYKKKHKVIYEDKVV